VWEADGISLEVNESEQRFDSFHRDHQEAAVFFTPRNTFFLQPKWPYIGTRDGWGQRSVVQGWVTKVKRPWFFSPHSRGGKNIFPIAWITSIFSTNDCTLGPASSGASVQGWKAAPLRYRLRTPVPWWSNRFFAGQATILFVSISLTVHWVLRWISPPYRGTCLEGGSVYCTFNWLR
jgi:hypothetical protein